jgi:hypothetical protein
MCAESKTRRIPIGISGIDLSCATQNCQVIIHTNRKGLITREAMAGARVRGYLGPIVFLEPSMTLCFMFSVAGGLGAREAVYRGEAPMS